MPSFDPVLISWGIVVRVGQALLDAGPTLLAGGLVAGVFSCMLGPRGTARLFGVGTRKSLLQAWVMGMLLPVCALGVFPVLRELRRAGVSGGTLLAFALTAPLYNPLSLLYGLTLSEPIVIISFAFFSLIVVSVVGLVFDRMFSVPAPGPLGEAPLPTPGLRRLLAVALAAGQALLGWSLVCILVSLLGVALLVLAVPFGSLEHLMQHDDPRSPVLMVLVALPAYEAPIRAMMHMGLLFDHGNSVGAALVLLIVGAGTNLGTLAWSWRHFGLKLTLAWFALVLGVVLALAYAINQPLDFAAQREDHTHAFDDYASPFPPGTLHQSLPELVEGKLWDRAGPAELVGLGGTVLLVALALAVRLTESVLSRWQGRDWCLAKWLAQPRSIRWDWVIPGKVLAALALGGLVVLSVVGCYIYYPPPGDLFTEMLTVRSDVHLCVLHENKDLALRAVPRLDALTRKLEVSVFLRTGRYHAAGHEKAERLRETLEQLRDAFRQGTFSQRSQDEWNRQLFAAWREFREAFADVPR
jgi:uncharacterized membrane protein YraQ (UPF0718 family)